MSPGRNQHKTGSWGKSWGSQEEGKGVYMGRHYEKRKNEQVGAGKPFGDWSHVCNLSCLGPCGPGPDGLSVLEEGLFSGYRNKGMKGRGWPVVYGRRQQVMTSGLAAPHHRGSAGHGRLCVGPPMSAVKSATAARLQEIPTVGLVSKTEQPSRNDPRPPALLCVATVTHFMVKHPQWRKDSPAVFGFHRLSQDSSQMFWFMAKLKIQHYHDRYCRFHLFNSH